MNQEGTTTTTPSVQDAVALLKEAVLLLVKRHAGDMYLEWPHEDAKRLSEIVGELNAPE